MGKLFSEVRGRRCSLTGNGGLSVAGGSELVVNSRNLGPEGPGKCHVKLS